MHTVPIAMQRWLLFFTNHQLVVSTDNSTVLQGLLRRSVQGFAIDPLCTSTLLSVSSATVHNTHTDAQSSVPKVFEIAHQTMPDTAPKMAPDTAPNTTAKMTLDTVPNTAPETTLDIAHLIQCPIHYLRQHLV